MKKINLLLLITIIFTSILIILLLVSNVFFPAYISYSIACKPKIYEEKFSSDYSIVGQVTLDNETQEVVVEVFEQDPQVLKHELIHVNQLYKNRLYSCKVPIGRYFNEVEAYTFQDLPDRIFYKLYDSY